jgi:pyruvate dehydrogenase E1 component alpha subunit
LKSLLIERGDATEDDLKAFDREVREVINEAAEFAQTSPEPDPSELYTDVLLEA